MEIKPQASDVANKNPSRLWEGYDPLQISRGEKF